MKILLSTPPLHPYQSYNFKFPRFPILNLPLLAATAVDKHEVRVISHAANPDRPHILFKTAEDFRPNVVGFALPSSVSAMELEAAIARLKHQSPDMKIVAGGPFATFEPDFCLDLGCDAVFGYEAEETFPEWIDSGGRKIGVIGDKTIIENLDRLPTPAWDLLDYKPVIYSGRKAAAIEMSRGCPYGCTFCTVHQFGIRYREKSADRVLSELGDLWDMGFAELLFVDNSFAINEKAAEELADGIMKAGWAFEFGAYLRADTISAHPDLMGLLSQAGLRYTIVGFESYADSSLAEMNKAVKHEINIKASEILRKEQIFSIGSHIYGTPGESLSDCKRTYHLGVRHSDLFKAGIFTPLPGSPLYANLKETNSISTDDPLAMDYVHYQLGEAEHQKKIQILNLIFFIRYYLSPRRMISIFSSNFWKRRIFWVEYQTIIMRVLSMFRWPFRKRDAKPQFDCL